MKKIKKLLALCLALATLLLCVPFTALAAGSEYGPEDLRSIHGIDYNRITQKATGDTKSYPVELKMGDLSFNGELTGSHGLSYEELNKIINEVLKEKKLTVEQIQLVKALAANVEDKAVEHWGLQVLEGLISYLPMNENVEFFTGGWSDIFAYIVHDMDEKSVVEYLLERQKQNLLPDEWKEAEEAINSKTEFLHSIGKIGTDKIPMLGEILNTIKVGKEWSEGNERLDKYLKALEQKMADVNDFYSECSRRANDLAEEKDGGGYAIKFDAGKNYRTYSATFWGVPNLTMGATLSGVLEGSNTEGVAGTYTGTLWLDVELEAPETFDSGFASVYPLNIIYNTAKSCWTLPYHSGGATNKTTVLERSVQGNISVTVSEVTGTVSCTPQGSITSGNDEITFSFDHKWEDRFSPPLNPTIYQYWHYTSSDPLELVETTEKGTESGAHPAGIGTVWKPLESGMTMTINFGNR